MSDDGTYLREHYGVPARIGGRVLADKKPATIVGFAGQYLVLRLDDEKRDSHWHPTWAMTYLDAETAR